MVFQINITKNLLKVPPAVNPSLPPCDILVPHIDSRVKIIDDERPGASPCDLLLVIVRVL
jgi:hypothetical protein